VITTLAGGCLLAPAAGAFDERLEDLSASVEVASVSEVDVDTAHLAFTDLVPGQTTVLGEGRHFNQVRCRSNSGRPWYLKARVESLRHLEGGQLLPAPFLKWKVVDSTGHGEPAGAPGSFEEFSDQLSVIYSAQGDDLRGREVVLSFQYSLTGPPTARAGAYAGTIVYSMEEAP
jgi:hypothetical protein